LWAECALSQARPGISCFFLDFDLHGCRSTVQNRRNFPSPPRSSTTEGVGKFENKYIYKFLGNFGADAGKRYVVEVKFTKDGTPLNIANLRLIIIKEGYI
jgi:hypothetical protein